MKCWSKADEVYGLDTEKRVIMTLNDAKLGEEYEIKDIDTAGDEEMKSFLFSLG